MNYEFNQWLDEAYKKMFSKIDTIFSEHQFKWNASANEWQSATYLSGEPHRRHDKTVITAKAPYCILEHGAEAVNLYTYIKQSRRLADSETTRFISDASGLSLPNGSSQANKQRAKVVKPISHKESQPKKETQFDVIPGELMERTFGGFKKNIFVQFLIQKFGSEQASKAMKRFLIGSAKNGGVIFWYLDENLQARSGKIMHYNPDGHRDKSKNPSWVHSKLNEKFKFSRCLFGLHQITENQKDVGIVESEKTAVICSIYLPQKIWLATGGSQGLSAELLKPLKNRTITLIPDADKVSDWQKKAKEISTAIGIPIKVDSRFTAYTTDSKADLADVLLKYSVEKFNTEAPQIFDNQRVKSAIEKNPAVKSLIQKFDCALL